MHVTPTLRSCLVNVVKDIILNYHLFCIISVTDRIGYWNDLLLQLQVV